MAYSEVKIGGLTCWVDPDTISSSMRPLVKVTPAVNGVTFIPFPQFNPNSLSYMQDLSISGQYSDAAFLTGLESLAALRSLVQIDFPPDNRFAGKFFIIISVQDQPIKPGVLFPGEILVGGDVPTIRYNFTVNLQLANSIV